ncbi:uncharacterized protein CLUP02_13740 [Colletotrichum lupini]|uniref:Uncharacterized protein n=1 Tax=Colletotrichum lupini TaxID=145971 RepID=A0A9Q8T4S3_9PEZI|nr:uncharacterized protein CLUP02_13740 [Colletotrichum lupini]UQC88217.1 hypothetical protein CLUP02_13740 [Colletotrichum lupini]
MFGRGLRQEQRFSLSNHFEVRIVHHEDNSRKVSQVAVRKKHNTSKDSLAVSFMSRLSSDTNHGYIQTRPIAPARMCCTLDFIFRSSNNTSRAVHLRQVYLRRSLHYRVSINSRYFMPFSRIYGASERHMSLCSPVRATISDGKRNPVRKPAASDGRRMRNSVNEETCSSSQQQLSSRQSFAPIWKSQASTQCLHNMPGAGQSLS